MKFNGDPNKVLQEPRQVTKHQDIKNFTIYSTMHLLKDAALPAAMVCLPVGRQLWAEYCFYTMPN
jgi:methyl coenzyme M reductase subunit C